MGSLFKSLSEWMGAGAHAAGKPNGAHAQCEPGGSDPGPSTLTTPLLPLEGDAAVAPAPPRPRRRTQAQGQRDTSTEGAETVPPHAIVPVPQRAPRASAPSRALHAVVRATTQVALPTPVEPTAVPRTARSGHRSAGVVLTETEKLRLQVMQVQLKLTGLALYDGPIDGMMNPELVAGVRHFQTLKGMRDSGMLTAGTLTALGVHPID